MKLGDMQVSLRDEDRVLMDRLTNAIQDLAKELHTYNHPPIDYLEMRANELREESEGL